MNRENICSIVTKHLTGNYVEIGTDKGSFSKFLLDNTPCKKLFFIDPYTSYANYKDAINNVTGDSLYNHVKTYFSNYGQDLDFVYIDGNHSYKYVLEDLKTWYPKLRKGGIIMGDDLVDFDDNKRDENGDVRVDWSINCFGYYGVFKALRDFSTEKGLKYEIYGNQFIIRK